MPLTIDLPPAVLDALKGRAAARNRSPEQEAAVAVAASLDVLLNQPAAPPDDGDDRGTDPETVAWLNAIRATALPPPETPPDWPPPAAESLQDYLRRSPGVETEMSPGEWAAYWETLERDGEGRPDVETAADGVRGDERAAA